MRLSELEPHWTRAESDRTGQGILFLCPKCKDHYLGVWFANPLDGKSPLAPRPDATPDHRWQREGNTFETLTITPSIQIVDGCGWHGFITKGEAITV